MGRRLVGDIAENGTRARGKMLAGDIAENRGRGDDVAGRGRRGGEVNLLSKSLSKFSSSWQYI